MKKKSKKSKMNKTQVLILVLIFHLILFTLSTMTEVFEFTAVEQLKNTFVHIGSIFITIFVIGALVRDKG